nr:immunoglobulin heavy chain junction region [Macaca mulatta]MOV54465.1 immunoglobulin heavy chain junction region [Macaca mulatta]MOV54815.1 immunoglobulin heavy chain junction region [Macaca mulatta]MOV54863.1 immunoglobulin heavy chain junction region [Macaca mulatta]MOV54941.1 immunoglobulin heavy chain junction region [Macaca mulatta]
CARHSVVSATTSSNYALDSW